MQPKVTLTYKCGKIGGRNELVDNHFHTHGHGLPKGFHNVMSKTGYMLVNLAFLEISTAVASWLEEANYNWRSRAACLFCCWFCWHFRKSQTGSLVTLDATFYVQGALPESILWMLGILTQTLCMRINMSRLNSVAWQNEVECFWGVVVVAYCYIVVEVS